MARVVKDVKGTPFDEFKVEGKIEAQVTTAFGTNGVDAAAVVKELNDIGDGFRFLDSTGNYASDCFKDKVLCVPTWACFLPGICCLGGGCLVNARQRQRILDMIEEYDDVLKRHSEGEFIWQLCCVTRAKTMEEQMMRAGGAGGGGDPNATKVTRLWIECTRKGASSAV